MNTLPKISIVLPIYNVEQYLDKCVTNLLNQTIKDIEIILVDDESPDNCPSMCDEYARKDNRVKVVHQKNTGYALARNSGMDIATGEYIGFVDPDDYPDLDMFEKMISATEDGKYDIVYCGYKREIEPDVFMENRNFEEIRTFDSSYRELLAMSFVHTTELVPKQRFTMAVWTAIYKSEMINASNARFYSERVVGSEDIIFQVQMVQQAKFIKMIPDVLYYHTCNPTSYTHTFEMSKIERPFNLIKVLMALVPSTEINKNCILYEFYGRICTLLKMMMLSRSHSIREKYQKCKELSYHSIWMDTFFTNYKKKCHWRHKLRIILLRKRKPVSLMLFTLFDYYSLAIKNR